MSLLRKISVLSREELAFDEEVMIDRGECFESKGSMGE